jgi:uncharacterized phage infection (PIP) family protein YhgE
MGLSKEEAKFIETLENKGVRFFCTECSRGVALKLDSGIASVNKSAKLDDRLSNIHDKIIEMNQKLDGSTSKISNTTNLGNQLDSIHDKINEVNKKLDEIGKESRDSLVQEHRTYAASLTESVNLLRQHQVSLSERTTQFNKELQENLQALKETSNNASKVLVDQTNFLDQEKRKNCAILHKVPESDNGTLAEKLVQICKDLAFPPDQILQSFRLGKRMDNKNRPIKVTFSDETKKWDFLKRANANKINGAFVTLDLTQEERERDFQARKRVRELRTTNQEAVYRIKNAQVLKREGKKWILVD